MKGTNVEDGFKVSQCVLGFDDGSHYAEKRTNVV